MADLKSLVLLKEVTLNTGYQLIKLAMVHYKLLEGDLLVDKDDLSQLF